MIIVSACHVSDDQCACCVSCDHCLCAMWVIVAFRPCEGWSLCRHAMWVCWLFVSGPQLKLWGLPNGGWEGSVCNHFPKSVLPTTRPRGLTFTWWGSYGLCVEHKPTELTHSFLFCSCVYFSLMALSAIFHSVNSPNSSLISHSVIPALFLPCWSFQLYISLWKSP